MKTINHYKVIILKHPDSKNVNKFEVEKLKVGLENENYVVLINDNFTKLNKTKRGSSIIYETIDHFNIYERNYNISWMDGLIYELYTYKVKKPETIKKEIEKWISDKHGYLLRLDLEFLCSKA